MPLYEIETLAHVNRSIRVDAADTDAGYEIAAASLTAQLRNAGIPDGDLVLVEGVAHKDLEYAGLACGECSSEDVTIPDDGSELFCHSCETSCPLPHAATDEPPAVPVATEGPVVGRPDDDGDDLRRAVVADLVVRGITAQHWHSGGGIVGIRIEVPSGADLFTTLETDDGEAWTGLDVCDADGELVASAHVHVRPLGSSWAPVGAPGEFAEALADLVALFK